jgi:hypothetical protein
MSLDQCRELEDLGKVLVEVREKLESLQASGSMPETNPLHAAISHAHWLCFRICEQVRRQTERAFRTT